ncbi:MAG: hypothetical protein ACR2PL_27205 [Dehalococcoidia bacterium]
MQIDWQHTINEIFADKLACLRCGALDCDIVVGFSRSPAAAEYSPRKHECAHKDECDARKLVVVCDACARELRLRAQKVDGEGLMAMLVSECRRELEECLDYISDYWQEDLDIDPSETEKRLEEVDAQVFAEEDGRRRKLEEEYLLLHRWFREHHFRIPSPGWRGEYAEEIIELGYPTLLGD